MTCLVSPKVRDMKKRFLKLTKKNENKRRPKKKKRNVRQQKSH